MIIITSTVIATTSTTTRLKMFMITLITAHPEPGFKFKVKRIRIFFSLLITTTAAAAATAAAAITTAAETGSMTY